MAMGATRAALCVASNARWQAGLYCVSKGCEITCGIFDWCNSGHACLIDRVQQRLTAGITQPHAPAASIRRVQASILIQQSHDVRFQRFTVHPNVVQFCRLKPQSVVGAAHNQSDVQPIVVSEGRDRGWIGSSRGRQ